MWCPERKVSRLKCLSCEHSFFWSNNLYKHYRTFTDHLPEAKPSLNCREATDLFLDKDLKASAKGKPDFGNFSKEGLPVGLGLVLSLWVGLNGVNCHPSNGPKINRKPSKTGYFYRQPSNERAKISRQISQISFNDWDLFLVFTHVMRRSCWCTKQWQNVAQVLHNNRIKFPKDFSAIVLYTNMAAVTSAANQELT